MPGKPGQKTTEFLLTVATSLGVVFAAIVGELPPGQSAKVTGFMVSAYAICRAVVKVGEAFAVASAIKHQPTQTPPSE